MHTLVKKGSRFRRKVIQRHSESPIDEVFKHPYPAEKWFWCYPAQDNSSSVKGTTWKEYQYEALTDFVILSSDQLSDILPIDFQRDIVMFSNMSHPVHELQVLEAVLNLPSDAGVVYGITRQIGSGLEYVFFSAKVSSLLRATELQNLKSDVKAVQAS